MSFDPIFGDLGRLFSRPGKAPPGALRLDMSNVLRGGEMSPGALRSDMSNVFFGGKVPPGALRSRRKNVTRRPTLVDYICLFTVIGLPGALRWGFAVGWTPTRRPMFGHVECASRRGLSSLRRPTFGDSGCCFVCLPGALG